MYMRIWSDEVDLTDLSKAEYEIRYDGARVKGKLRDNGDGSFVGSVDLGQFSPGTGKIKLKLEDNVRRKYEVRDIVFEIVP